MPILTKSSAGTVTGLWGSAFIRLPNGKLKPLNMGDKVKPGEHIVTTQDGIVQITPSNGKVVEVKPVTGEVDRVIAAIERGDEDEATAAGLTGGADGGLQEGLRVSRVSETVGQQSFDFGTGRLNTVEPLGASVAQAAAAPAPAPVLPPAPVSISISNVSANEGAGKAVFTLTLSGPSATPVTVHVATQDGTAKAGSDYAGITDRTITFAPGQTTATVEVAIVNDSVFEGTENYNLALSNPSSNAVIAGNGTGVGTISDDGSNGSDDDRPRIAGINSVQAIEGNPLDFTVNLSHQSTTATQITLKLESKTATLGTDTGEVSVSVDGGLTYTVVTPAADGSFIVSVPANSALDALHVRLATVTGDGPEGAEFLTLTAQTPRDIALGTAPVAAGTILDASTSPAASDDTASTNENQPRIIDVLGNDSDADGDPLTITAINGQPISGGTPVAIPGQGTVALQPDGKLAFTPEPGFNGPVNFTYTVTDGVTPVTAKVTLLVVEVNDAPQAGDDQVSTPPGGTVVVDVLANDVDPDGPSGSLRVTEIGGQPVQPGGVVSIKDPSGQEIAKVTLNPDGKTVTVDPVPGHTGPVDFDYKATDPSGASDTGHVTVAVLSNPPLAQPDEASTSATADLDVSALDGVIQSAANGSGRDIDFNGGSLSVSGVSFTKADGASTTGQVGQPIEGAFGTLTLNADGSYRYVPNDAAKALGEGEGGQDLFIYTVTNAAGETATTTLAVNVINTNEGPVAQSDIGVTPVGQPLVIDVVGNDRDADGDPLSVTEINGVAVTPGGDPVSIIDPANSEEIATAKLDADGKVVIEPVADYTGPVKFEYTVVDPSGETSTGSVNVEVIPNNPEVGQPFAQADEGLTDQDTTLTVTAEDGVIQSASAPDGRDVVAAIDANGDATEIEGRPLIVSTVVFAESDGSVTGALAGEPIQGHFGTLTLNADGSYNYVPNAAAKALPDGEGGQDVFTYTVIDGLGNDSQATLSIQVTGTNDGPVAQPDVAQATPGQSVTVDVVANDKDPDGEPVKVTEVNGQPVTVGGTPVGITDPTTGGVIATVALTPDGKLTVVPAPGFDGPVQFDYTVADPSGATGTSTAIVNVGATNQGPAAQADTGLVGEDAVLSVNAAQGVIQSSAAAAGRDLDPNGDSLSVSAVSLTKADGTVVSGTVGQGLSGQHGTLTLNANGAYQYVPNDAAKALGAGDSVQDVFTYTVKDGGGLSSTTTLTITVTGANDAPVTKADVGLTPSGQAITVPVLVNDSDPDSDALTLTAINGQPVTSGVPVSIKDLVGNDIAKVTLNGDGTLTVAPLTGYLGPVDFSYTVSDGTASSTGQVQVTVYDGVNTPPVAHDDVVQGTEGVPLTFDPRANDTDEERDALTITQVNGKDIDATHPVVIDGKGTVSLNADGTLTFTPLPNVSGSIDLPYTVTDGKSPPVAAVVHLTLTDVNDPPVITNTDPNTGNYKVTTEEDKPVSGQVTATDKDGDTLTYSKASDPTHGSVVVNDNGTWTYTPTKDFNGSDKFTVLVSDGEGGTTTATIDIGVTPVNDPPVVITDDPNIDPNTGHYKATTEEEKPVSGQVKGSDVDGDPLIYTKGSDPANGTVVVNNDGTWTYTPAKDFNGSDKFTVVVSDGHGGTVTATVDIGVTPVNDAPVAVDDASNTDEDQAKTINVLVNDKDADGDKLTVTQINGQPINATTPVAIAGKGTVSLNPDGSLTFTPVKDYNGPAEFSYTVADPAGLTSTAKVTVNVGAVSDTPVAVNDSAVTSEDTPVTINVLANDSDADVGDKLVVKEINGQAITKDLPVTIAGKGVVSLNEADGTLTFTPAKDYNGEFTFNYTVSDGQTPVKADVTVKVNPVNDAPVAVNDSVNTEEEKPVTIPVRLNDTDVDGDALTVVNVTQGTHGTVVIDPVSGNPIYTPESDYTGPDAFTYTVRDPSGATSTATVNVSVGGVNDAPVAQNDEAAVNQDGVLNLNALDGVILSAQVPEGRDEDLDGDTLTVATVSFGGTVGVVGQPLNGEYGVLVLRADGSYTYTPNDKAKTLGEGDNAEDLFTYTVRDPGGLSSDPATLSVRVEGRNDGPVAVADSGKTLEDTTVSLNLLTNDKDVDENDVLSLKEINGQAAPVGSVFAIKDAAGNEIAKVTVKAGGVVDVDPVANYNGPVNFNYTVTDGKATSVAQVNVLVDSSNDAPVAQDDALSPSNEDATFTFDPRANDTDPENDQLTITQVNGQPISAASPVVVIAGKGEITLKPDGTLSFKPVADFNGKFDVPYTISDGDKSSSAVIHIDIKAVNDPPVITDPNADPATGNYSVTTLEDKPVSGQVKASDKDGDALTYSKASDPAHGTVNVNADGTWTYTPAKDFNGSDKFTVLVSDGNGGTVTSTVNIGVTPVNDPPVITDPNADPATGNYNVTTPEDKPVSGQVKASDVDGDKLSYVKGSDPAHGTVVVNADGTWTYTPAKDYNGADKFTVVVSDGQGGTVSSTVNIGVTPVNDAPVAVNDAITTNEDTPIKIDVLANDSDADAGDKLTLKVTQIDGQTINAATPVTIAGKGVVSLNADGTLTFTPAKDFVGPVEFSYTVADTTGATSTAKVLVDVGAVSDTPVAVNDSAVTSEDTPVTINVLANDSDADVGDKLVVKEINGQAITKDLPVTIAGKGVVSLNEADGTLTFTPAKDYNGEFTFNYTVSDGQTPVKADVTVKVNPVNDAPVAANDSVNTEEEKPVTIPVRLNDTDVDGDALTVVSVTQGTHGTVVIDPISGNPVYTPAVDYVGPDSFNYTVRDPSGATSTATVNVSVGGVNDAPVARADVGAITQNGELNVTAQGGVIQSALVAAGRDSDPEGDSLSVSTVNFGNQVGTVGQALAGQYGTLTLNADGSYKYTPNAAAKALDLGETGKDVFGYTVRDPGDLSSSTTLTITVAGSNDGPVAVADNATTPEDTTVTLNVVANDTDVDVEPLSLTQVNGQAATVGSVFSIKDAAGNEIAKVTVKSLTGLVEVDPAANYNGPVNFNYTVSDGTATSVGQVNVLVDSSNDAPVAQDDALSPSNEDATFTFDPRANDTDPENDQLTITQVNGQPISAANPVVVIAGKGEITLKADGTLSFKPVADFNGKFDVPYTISDGKGGTDSAVIHIDIKAVNDPPVITDPNADPATGNYSVTTLEDKPVSGQVKASDKDGDALTYSKASDPAHGTVNVNADGTWTYTPAKDFNGSDKFTVLVSDGNGGTVTSTVNIGVTPVNDPPVITDPNADPATGNYNVTTLEDTPVLGQVKASDADGDTLTYAAGEQPLHGTVTVNPNGTWTYIPAKDYNGSDRFTVVVDDGQGGTVTSTVNVGITPVNDAPVLANQSGNVSEEGLAGGLADTAGTSDTTNAASVTGKMVATDADGTTPTSWTLGEPTSALTSNGLAVTWTGQGTQTLTGTAGGVTVATLKIDGSGQYTFDLKAPLDHPTANAEDVLPINFTVNAGDGALTSSSTLTINVEDDAPSTAVSQTVATSVTDANVMVILDMSTSMRQTDVAGGPTRFTSAINSIKTLLDKYDGIGDVKVRLVTFNTDAQALGTTWTTVAAAKTLLDGLVIETGKGTNYDAALNSALSAFTADGKLSTGINVSYFISDGLPTYGNGSTSALTGSLNGDGSEATAPTGDEGIQTAEETTWKNFLTTNSINSYALGVGSGVTTAQTALNPIAYNGKTNANSDAVLVTSLPSLDGVLGATVPAPVSGNLLTGSLLPTGGAGADKPAYVKAITIDGVTYTYDPANGGSITVSGGTSKGSFDTATDTLTVTTKEGGHYAVGMFSGDYLYTVPPSVTVRNISEVMGFTVTDADGDKTSANLTVNVTNAGAPTPNDPPVVTAQSASVSEEGLAGGLLDNTGTSDTTNNATVTGKMVATDPDGNPITGWTLEAPTTAITSGGVAVTWTGNGTSTLTATAGTVQVGTLSIDASGNYTFALKAPLDHANKAAEDVLALNFKALANDGRALGSNTLTINVEDDGPSVAQPVAASATVLDTNLMLVLDVSGSMAGDGVAGTTRLANAISSMNTLLDKYDALGDVRVRLVTFSTNAQAQGDVWTTVAQAKTILTTIGSQTPVGGTNYDEALGDAMTAFGSAGKLGTGQNVAYFISDGAPTYGSGTVNELVPAGSSPGTPATNGSGTTQTGSTDTGIQSAEETLWRNFLIANDIDAYALGVGGVTAAQRVYLDPIAYDGRSEHDRNGLVVTAFSQLDGVLANTIPTPASGNLLSGSFLSGAGVGADGKPIVKSLTVDGITYTYDPANGGGITVTGGTSAGVFDTATDTLTITTKQGDGSVGGKFIVDMDGGDYRYEVPPAVSGTSLSQSLNFVISDGDGDTTGSTLTVNVSKPTVANGGTAADNLAGGSGVDFISGGDGGDNIAGNAGDDKLYGNGGDDVITGGAGTDQLSGGTGNDNLNGGDGNDLLVGGFGNDVMTGGAGSDVFAWTLADPAATGTARAVDTIKDFNPAAASAGGDVLDLRDLLSGENTTGGTGNLQNFLDFNTVTTGGVATTTIRVSPTGGFANGTYSAAADTHEIVLEGVDIRAGLGLASTATDNQIIAKMISDGKLLVDNT